MLFNDMESFCEPGSESEHRHDELSDAEYDVYNEQDSEHFNHADFPFARWRQRLLQARMLYRVS